MDVEGPQRRVSDAAGARYDVMSHEAQVAALIAASMNWNVWSWEKKSMYKSQTRSMPANRGISTRPACDTSSDTRDSGRYSTSLHECFVQDDIHSASSKTPNITTNGYVHDTLMTESPDMLPKSNPAAMPPATSNDEELPPLTSQTSKEMDVMEPWISLRSNSEPVFRISYLTAERCFEIPHESILREFLRYYFLFVHPMLPMINEKLFWDEFNLSGSAGHYALRGPSLLLLQAMLFAASPVSMATSNVILRALIKLPVRS